MVAMQQLIDYLKKYPITFKNAVNNPIETCFVGTDFGAKKGWTFDQWVAIPYKNGTLCYDQCKSLTQEFCNKLIKENVNSIF